MGASSQNRDNWPEVLPGFEHISRIWESTQNLCASKILPGEYYVTCHNEIITTVLGSCISACIWDPISGVGGMNHFMLPGNAKKDLDQRGDSACLATRYGIAAMETLIGDVLKRGSRKDRLQVKLSGGAKLLKIEVDNAGERNVQFVKQFLETEGIAVVAEDLGGTHPRKINFFPKTGEAMVKRLRSLQNQVIADQEKKYESTLDKSETVSRPNRSR